MFFNLKDGKQVYYTIQGNPAGATVLFLNGLSQSTVVWNPLCSLLEDTYHIVLMDLVFQGQSDKTGDVRSIGQHADDVIELLDHLQLEKISLVGISYGSVVSQHLMVRYPRRLKNVALLSTLANNTARFLEIHELWANTLETNGLKSMMDLVYPFSLGPSFFEAPPIPIPQLKEMSLGINEGQAVLKLMQGLSQDTFYISQLAEVDLPTLVIHGEYDFLCLPEMGKAVADAIPGARFELIRGVGHTLNVEAIPQISDLLKGFL